MLQLVSHVRVQVVRGEPDHPVAGPRPGDELFHTGQGARRVLLRACPEARTPRPAIVCSVIRTTSSVPRSPGAGRTRQPIAVPPQRLGQLVGPYSSGGRLTVTVSQRSSAARPRGSAGPAHDRRARDERSGVQQRRFAELHMASPVRRLRPPRPGPYPPPEARRTRSERPGGGGARWAIRAALPCGRRAVALDAGALWPVVPPTAGAPTPGPGASGGMTRRPPHRQPRGLAPGAALARPCQNLSSTRTSAPAANPGRITGRAHAAPDKAGRSPRLVRLRCEPGLRAGSLRSPRRWMRPCRCRRRKLMICAVTTAVTATSSGVS
jgi:hypothetical protein